ncbi:MAG: DUF1574 domain-containing protein [Flavobacterium sp. JAD_PAG50586_2]|nr:MAG: DUF1574 domain-containing protein [Flavobacterium sp. JAD_PAG50586_2]
MKKFATLTILFSLPVIIVLIAFEFSLRHIPNDYAYKRHYLDTKSSEIEVLYLGSSHIYCGINPEFSELKSFNASHVSQSLNYDLAILEKYKDNWSKLKCIVLPVDYFSMYTTIETGVEKWRVKNYTIYYGLNSIISNEGRFELTTGKFSSNISRLWAYHQNGSNDLSCNKLGWGTNYNSKNSKDLIETGKIAAERHTVKIIDTECYEKNRKALETIIGFAKTKDIKVILITCPAYKSYVNRLNQKQLNSTISFINKLCLENSNAFYYNLLNDKSYTSDDFFDANHLNDIGARKLTLQLDYLINQNLSK